MSPTRSKAAKTNGRTNADVTDVKNRASGHWLEILGDLAPDLEDAIAKVGRHVPCPVHGGKDGFRLFDDAAQRGGGVCNSCGNFSDGLAILKWVNGWKFSDALQSVANWLNNHGEIHPAAVARAERGSATKPDPKAMKLFERLEDGFIDDRRKIRKYLKFRGLSGQVPEVVRFHPGLGYFENGEKVADFPALVAPFQRLDGQVVGYIRIYLDPDSPGKAPVEKAKKNTPALWKGALHGAAIRLGGPGPVLGIAEGLETGLAIQEATGMPVWAAGSAGGMEAIEIPQEVQLIYVWADNDSSGRGEEAALALTERLMRAGRDVLVVFPTEVDQDWLDVLNKADVEALRQAMKTAERCELVDDEQATAKTTDPDDVLAIVEELNSRHFIVTTGGRVCVATEITDPQTGRPDLVLGTPADLKLKYLNRPVGEKQTAASAWLAHPARREYAGIVFDLGRNIAGYYNLFSGFAVKPRKGDCSLYWEHTRENICNNNAFIYRFVRCWMAHAVQYPAQLPGTALALRGLQGTGKGIFVDKYGELFGNHFQTLYSLDQVTGRFNGHLKNVLLLHANEAVCQGDRVGEGVLKGLITDPYTPIEYKGRDIFQVRNFKRLIVATNEDWAVPMGMDDRRFLVLDVNPAKKEDKSYFSAIVEQMQNGGLEALMYDLLHEDLTGFDVRTVPYSGTSFDVKLHSAPAIVQWFYELLCDERTVPDDEGSPGAPWNPQPPRDYLYRDYLDWCRDARLPSISKPLFGRSLRKLLPGLELGETRRLIQGNRGGLRLSLRLRCYVLPSLAECRAAFQKFSKSGPEIWPSAD